MSQYLVHSFSSRGLTLRSVPSSLYSPGISSAGSSLHLYVAFRVLASKSASLVTWTSVPGVCGVHRDIFCARCPQSVPSDSSAIALHLFQVAECDVERGVRGLYACCMQVVSGHNQLSVLYPACFSLCSYSQGMLLMSSRLKITAPGQAVDSSFKEQHAKMDGGNWTTRSACRGHRETSGFSVHPVL